MRSKEIYYTKVGRSEPTEINDESLKSWILETFEDFEAAYIPEGYNVVFVLFRTDKDPLKDEWTVMFFKKTIDFSQSKSITLDNLEDLNDVDEKIKYQSIKKIDGNYEVVLDSAREIIEKYKQEIE